MGRGQKTSYFLAVLATEPGSAFAIVDEIAEALHPGVRVRVIVFSAEGVVEPATRRILRRRGWNFVTGGRPDAEKAVETSAADKRLVVIAPSMFDPFKLFETPHPPKTKAEPELDLEPELPNPDPEPDLPAPREPVEPDPEPDLPTRREPPAPDPEPELEPETELDPPHFARLATFLVATHHRPKLLAATLGSLMRQASPTGWTFNVFVGGQPNDPGRAVAEGLGAEYIVVKSQTVTTKLNAMLRQVKGELVLLADDDDIQPSNRLWAAVRAFESGFDWSASGDHWFYDIPNDCLTLWSGPASAGLVGTSLSISTKLARKARGWPSMKRGKDAPMAKRLKDAGGKFRSVTAEIGPNLVCLQHGKNIWTRPVVGKGEVSRKGSFNIEGYGTLADNRERFEPSIMEGLWQVTGQQPSVQVLPASSRLVTCTDAGPGQSAFIEGLKSIGFSTISLPELRVALGQGKKVLLHGWGKSYDAHGKRFPGQVFVLWHSGWTGSDLMSEAGPLAAALRAHQAGYITLVWLDGRDHVPPGVKRLCPVWNPKEMGKLRGSLPKVPRRLIVGLHSLTPTHAKNSMGALVGCTGLGADIQVSEAAISGKRGAPLRLLLEDENHTVHTFLPHGKLMQLLSSAELTVHPSISDTWPYMVMESIYVGTPALISDVVAWAEDLPPWAQNLCIVRPATATKQIHDKVRFLLDHPDERDRLLYAQQRVLDHKAPIHARRALQLFESLGAKTRKRPRILLMSDVRGWAFDVNLRDMASYLPEYDFDFWYVVDGKPFPSMDEYDLVYVPYHRWKVVIDGTVPRDKAVASLRSWWFFPETPEPPGHKARILVNSFQGFHVVTRHNYDELRKQCPRLSYLTNPVNMTRIGGATTISKQVIASWNGNASHRNKNQDDVKGFWSIVVPACKDAKVPLEYAEYHTNRRGPAEMPEFYRKANLALCASLYEGASNSVMEAMAAGLALITTDCGNAREMQAAQRKHFGDTGIVIVERTEAAFVRVLKELREDPQRVLEMGRLNRAEIQARWSWEAWRDRYSDFLARGMAWAG